MTRHFDAGTLTVIIITFILFLAALLTKGFTHDLLLEAGVFLVSVKLIIMSYQNNKANEDLQSKLNAITRLLEDKLK